VTDCSEPKGSAEN